MTHPNTVLRVGATRYHRHPLDATWSRLIVLVVLGYLIMTRSFAYLGWPEFGLVLGELVIAAFFLTRWRQSFGALFGGMLKKQESSSLCWSLYLFLIYGVAQAIRGILDGFPPESALKSLVFSYYPLYVLCGLWLGYRYPRLLDRLVIALAWSNAIYGLAYILILGHVSAFLPWAAEVPLFGQPAGSAVAILALVTRGSSSRFSRLLLFLNVLVLLGLQVRAEWLGLLVGVLLWAVLTRRLSRLAVGSLLVAGVLATAYLGNLSLPSPQTRGGEISAGDIVGRLVASVNPDLASRYTENVDLYAGTSTWRLAWWSSIWNAAHSNGVSALLGQGYGYPMADLYHLTRGQADLRAPHSVFFFALGYGGWLMVALFTFLLLSLLRMCIRVHKSSGETFGMTFVAMSLAVALFSNYFEAPFGAIPFFVIIGLAITTSQHQPRPGRVPVEHDSVSRT